MNKVVTGSVFVVLLILLATFPFITIASVNTLFSLGIPYTIGTYFSMVWINLTVLGGLNNWADNFKKAGNK